MRQGVFTTVLYHYYYYSRGLVDDVLELSDIQGAVRQVHGADDVNRLRSAVFVRGANGGGCLIGLAQTQFCEASR